MTGHYAIKSIELIDFIDVKDIAIAEPFLRAMLNPYKGFIINEV
jgi:hypothetical protein